MTPDVEELQQQLAAYQAEQARQTAELLARIQELEERPPGDHIAPLSGSLNGAGEWVETGGLTPKGWAGPVNGVLGEGVLCATVTEVCVTVGCLANIETTVWFSVDGVRIQEMVVPKVESGKTIAMDVVFTFTVKAGGTFNVDAETSAKKHEALLEYALQKWT